MRTQGGNRFTQGLVGAAMLAVLATGAVQHVAASGNRILVVGHGPEQAIVQELARAFEKARPGSVVDVEWDRALDTIDMVRSGQADLAVGGTEEPGLRAMAVAWDGIALIINFTNPLSDVSTQQAQSLFTGKLAHWSDLDGADKRIEVIRRTADQNIDGGFERSLGIEGRMVSADKSVRQDQKALATVSGQDNAISYLSLKSALQAQAQGIPIRILTIDQVEPGDPTLKNGRYKLRRPVLFLSKPDAHPLVEAFTAFARSPEGQNILSRMYTPYEPPMATPAQAKPPGRETSAATPAS